MSEITQPEAKAFKAKSIARGRLLERFRCHVQEVVEHAEDEGDRVYFGTSNHFEYLKEIADEMDMWGWDAVIRERDEVDPYADLRKVRDENRSLSSELDRLREENERLREAVKPFAKYAGDLSLPKQRFYLKLLVCPTGDDHPENYGPHFQRALAALSHHEADKGGAS